MDQFIKTFFFSQFFPYEWFIRFKRANRKAFSWTLTEWIKKHTLGIKTASFLHLWRHSLTHQIKQPNQRGFNRLIIERTDLPLTHSFHHKIAWLLNHSIIHPLVACLDLSLVHPFTHRRLGQIAILADRWKDKKHFRMIRVWPSLPAISRQHFLHCLYTWWKAAPAHQSNYRPDTRDAEMEPPSLCRLFRKTMQPLNQFFIHSLIFCWFMMRRFFFFFFFFFFVRRRMERNPSKIDADKWKGKEEKQNVKKKQKKKNSLTESVMNDPTILCDRKRFG